MIAAKPLTLLILLLLAAVPSSAAKVNLKYTEADYDSWSTWDFALNAEQEEAMEKAGRAETRAKVKAAITDRLGAKDFVRAATGETPDFLVAIDGSLREVFDVRDYHMKVADHVAFVMEGGTSSYHEGTLMIRVLDASNGEVIWTGWVIEKIKNPNKPDKQIRRVVKKILSSFPPEAP